METQTEQITITESMTKKTKYLILLLVVLLSGVVYGAFVYFKNNLEVSYIESGPLTSLGLDSINDSGIEVGGFITLETETNDKNPKKYRFSAAEATLTEVQVSSTTPALKGIQLAVAADGRLQPHIYNEGTKSLTPLPSLGDDSFVDFAVSSDQTQYAYNVETTDTDREDGDPVPQWNIAIHTLGTDEVLTVPNARNPQWLSGSDAVIYIGLDGLYRMNVETHEPVKVFSLYESYSTDDQIVISPDSKTVILIKNDANMLAILKFENDDPVTAGLYEVGRMIDTESKYRSPVFSEDSIFYGVIAKNVGVDTGARLELRYVGNREVIKQALIIDGKKFSLNKWTLDK